MSENVRIRKNLFIFKAKRKNWKELPKEKWWIEGAVLQADNCAYIATSFVSGSEDEPLMVAAYEVIPETICQVNGHQKENRETSYWIQTMFFLAVPLVLFGLLILLR